jgi:hypothetical protein
MRRRTPAVLGTAVVLVAAGIGLWLVLDDSARTAPGRVQGAAPAGIECHLTEVPAAAAAAGVQAQTVCAAGPDVGGLRLFALSGPGAIDTSLRTQAGQERTALLLGECPADMPARQAWQRDGHSGTVLCYVLGDNTRYAWTVDDLDVVAVLDGKPQVPFPSDLQPVADFFAHLRFPP